MSSKPRLVDLRGGRKIPPPAPGDIRPPSPRRSHLKIRRRRVRAVVSAAVCVCALLVIYSIHAASYLPRFTYQHVLVTGAQTVSQTEVKNLVENKLAESSRGYISGRNIFVFDYATLSQDISAGFPSIKKAQVTRDTSLGNGLEIHIEERTAYARWCETSNTMSCFLLDDEGVVFAPAEDIATSTLPNQYVFYGVLSTTTLNKTAQPYGAIFAGAHFSGISTLLKFLHSAGFEPLGMRQEDDVDFTIPLSDGYYLKASYGADPESLVKNLALILQADALRGKSSLLEYVDLRFGNRIYYKFKGQPQTP